jgi:hypothetical protein
MKKTTLSFLLCLWAVSAFAQTSVMDFYNAKEKEMSKPMYPNQTKPTFTLNITKKDVANGFVAYDYTPALGYLAGVTNSPEQMAYFTSKDGQKFVAVVSIVCKGNYCSAEMPKFFTLENGALIDKTEQYLPAHVIKQIDKALFEKMATVIRSPNGKEVNFFIWVKFPKKNSTIQIGLQETNERETSYVVCELTYNEANGTFTFVKK